MTTGQDLEMLAEDILTKLETVLARLSELLGSKTSDESRRRGPIGDDT